MELNNKEKVMIHEGLQLMINDCNEDIEGFKEDSQGVYTERALSRGQTLEKYIEGRIKRRTELIAMYQKLQNKIGSNQVLIVPESIQVHMHISDKKM